MTAAFSQRLAVRRLLAPSFLLTLGAVFTLDALTGLIIIGYGNSYLVNVLAAPDAYPAYAVALYGFVKLVAAPAGGWMLERLRVATVAVAAGVASMAGLAFVLASHSVDAYFAGVAALSLGQALAWLVVFDAIGLQHSADERGAATATMGLVSAAATVIGLAAAALFSETAHWRLPFAVGLGLALASTWFLFLNRPGKPQPSPVIALPRPVQSATGGASAARHRRVAATVVIFAHFATISALIAGLAPLLLKTLDLSLLHAGIVMAPAAVGAALGMVAVGWRSRAGGRIRTAAMLYGGVAVAVGVMAASIHPAMLAIAALPLGLCLGGAQPVVNASLIDAARAETRTGVALGYLFFVEGVGSIAGPLFVGLVISGFGTRAGVVTIAVMAGVVALMAGVTSRQAKL